MHERCARRALRADGGRDGGIGGCDDDSERVAPTCRRRGGWSMSAATPNLPTSLGPDLVHRDGVWTLDLEQLAIVHGLSVLARALCEMVVQHARAERFDVVVERKLRSRENPELVDVHGIELVRLAVEPEVVDALLQQPELFERRLRALLGSLQRARFRELLLPRRRADAVALVAEFGDNGHRQRFLLEHVARRDGQAGAFRVTVAAAAAARIDLGRLPHVVIDDIENRQFLAGSTRIAETWAEACRREAERGRRSFREGRSPHSHLFKQLDQAGLQQLQRVSLQWSEAAQTFLLESVPSEVAHLLKRVLLACEDATVRRLLGERQVVRVDAGPLPVYLDLAQLGRVLELSLGQRRERMDCGAFLARMPATAAAAAQATADQPLRGVRVFLVHHMTAEVVGTIAALRALGCRDLVTLFVTYAGEPPASYLDAVLDLPPDEFAALALVNVPARGHVEGHYRLSEHYSHLDDAGAIADALRRDGRDRAYLTAMRAAASVPFLRQMARAEAAGERLLVVEDGGYLGPVLQDALLQGRTVAQFAAELGATSADARPLAGALGGRLVATVEHTRNGYDKLVDVARRHGKLAVPSYSIAVSQLKRGVESREVAASILNAVESVLNADGRILARRSALVLGCVGAIGGELVRHLLPRVDDADRQLFGVDLRIGEHPARCAAVRTFADVPPERWLQTDLVLGVTGVSIVRGADVERWLCGSPREQLVLASGSTKKVEFHDLMQWIDGLLRADEPTVGGRRVDVAVDEMLDPRTARLYAHRWRFSFRDDGRVRTVLAMGGLTPINFLFYGVSTELIDEVLAQLVTVALGALRNAAAGPVSPRLYAVDHECDADGRVR
jgi:hypothetical protein